MFPKDLRELGTFTVALLSSILVGYSLRILAIYASGREGVARWFGLGPPMAISTAATLSLMGVAIFILALVVRSLLRSPPSREK